MKLFSKNPFSWADECLLSRVFEPFAWRSEYYWGKDAFWWARVCIDVSMLGGVLTGIADDLPHVVGAASVLWIAFTAYYRQRMRFYVHLVELVTKRNTTAMNPSRHRVLERAVITLFSYVLIVQECARPTPATIGFVPFLVFFCLATYFKSCNLMPGTWEPSRKMRVVAVT